jgi:hypothetical protein
MTGQWNTWSAKANPSLSPYLSNHNLLKGTRAGHYPVFSLLKMEDRNEQQMETIPTNHTRSAGKSNKRSCATGPASAAPEPDPGPKTRHTADVGSNMDTGIGTGGISPRRTSNKTSPPTTKNYPADAKTRTVSPVGFWDETANLQTAQDASKKTPRR